MLEAIRNQKIAPSNINILDALLSWRDGGREPREVDGMLCGGREVEEAMNGEEEKK